MKKLTALCFALMLVLSAPGCASGRYSIKVEDPLELLFARPAATCRAGERVVIKTYIIYDADIECFVNGESIGKQTAVKTDDEHAHWEFCFDMPAENVTVTFKIVGGW